MKEATVKKKQPLSDFFKPSELQVPGQPANFQRRVCLSDVAQNRLLRVQFHDQLPSVRQDQAPASYKLRGDAAADRAGGWQVLGELANRVLVVLDSTLPSTLHGTSCVEDGIPLNPKYPDLLPHPSYTPQP